MPGLLVSIAVSEGEQVKAGQELEVLEAMKMENIIRTPADGIVRSIEVEKSDAVVKNQVLIKFE
jgi:propionyl-CoA carboxylase alpha chain